MSILSLNKKNVSNFFAIQKTYLPKVLSCAIYLTIQDMIFL